jgi:hypothetical protein
MTKIIKQILKKLRVGWTKKRIGEASHERKIKNRSSYIRNKLSSQEDQYKIETPHTATVLLIYICRNCNANF